MGVDDSSPDVRLTLLDTLESFRRLVESDEVRKRWDDPSVLPAYSVGALAGHTYNTVAAIGRYLDEDEPVDAPWPAGAYYAVAPSPDAAPELHDGIRARGEAVSSRGADQLVADIAALSARLRDRLAVERADRVVSVMAGRVLTLDDYLETRILELVVHSDDLAESTGRAVELPPEALAITVRHLLEVARQRHGDLAVARAFTRRERDTLDALHVL